MCFFENVERRRLLFARDALPRMAGPFGRVLLGAKRAVATIRWYAPSRLVASHLLGPPATLTGESYPPPLTVARSIAMGEAQAGASMTLLAPAAASASSTAAAERLASWRCDLALAL